MFYQYEPTVSATITLIDLLKVKISKTTVSKDLQSHPHWPSLLSVGDVLLHHGIENISFKSNIDRLEEIPVPFLAVIKSKSSPKDVIAVVESVTSDAVRLYYSETRRWEDIPKDEFVKYWMSNIALIADAADAKDEKDYIQIVKKERRANVTNWALLLILPILVVTFITLAIVNNGIPAIVPSVLALFTLVGCYVTGLLLWHELDEYNPVLAQICNAGKKTNCRSILNSKAAKIAGVSWSTIGFTYFIGGMITLLALGLLNSNASSIVLSINILALPYTIYSVIYQWRVARRWCVLCLTVQALLVLQFTTGFMFPWNFHIDPFTIGCAAMAYLIPFAVTMLVMHNFRLNKAMKRRTGDLQRLKNTPNVFRAMLETQRIVTNVPWGVGIMLGNPNARTRIVKVCNPYCKPCSKAHKSMEELLHNNPDIQMQILYMTTSEPDDVTYPPVKHLLAIAEKGNVELTKKAIADWYSPEKKDYDSFARKYQGYDGLNKQDAKISTMRKWCYDTGIAFTPTFFVALPAIDGQESEFRQLPRAYTVNDLHYSLFV